MNESSPQKSRLQRGTNYLLWDGDCGFCARCTEIAHGFNAAGFAILPYQSISESELKTLGLSHHKCSQELKSVAASGRVYGGAFAVNHFLWHHPQWRVLIALLYLFPILVLAEVIVYRFVAQNRTLVSRLVGLTACSIKNINPNINPKESS